MNAVNRLMHESWNKSKPRTSEFYVIQEGTVNMAMTSASERDQRDVIKQKLVLKRAQKEGRPHCLCN